MALDVAFSIEAGDFVDPDRAYDLFWAGVITNKRAFVCPGADCSAQVTCANLDKDVQRVDATSTSGRGPSINQIVSGQGRW